MFTVFKLGFLLKIIYRLRISISISAVICSCDYNLTIDPSCGEQRYESLSNGTPEQHWKEESFSINFPPQHSFIPEL